MSCQKPRLVFHDLHCVIVALVWKKKTTQKTTSRKGLVCTLQWKGFVWPLLHSTARVEKNAEVKRTLGRYEYLFPPIIGQPCWEMSVGAMQAM